MASVENVVEDITRGKHAVPQVSIPNSSIEPSYYVVLAPSSPNDTKCWLYAGTNVLDLLYIMLNQHFEIDF